MTASIDHRVGHDDRPRVTSCLRIHLNVFVAMVAVVLAVWAAVAATTDAMYFWQIWPILGGAIGYFSHAIAVPRPQKAL